MDELKNKKYLSNATWTRKQQGSWELKATKKEVRIRIRITSKEGKTSTHPICPTREETRLYDEISEHLNRFGVAIANNHFILFLITAALAAFNLSTHSKYIAAAAAMNRTGEETEGLLK